MARIVRHRPSTDRSHWWSSVLVGATLGAVAAWLVLRGGREAAETASAPRRGRSREPDLETMTARLARVAGTEQLRLRSLGGGILELVGSASPALDVPALLAALAMEPRVTVVVNRVWTPDAVGAAGNEDPESSGPAGAPRPKPAAP
jgi:hypothetical protein